MRRFILIAGVLATTNLATLAQSEVAQASPSGAVSNEFKARFFQEKAVNGMEITRGFLFGKTNQFSFVLPAGFRCRVEADQKTVRLISHDEACAVTVELKESLDSSPAPVEAAAFKALVLSRFPQGRITDESSVSIESRRGVSLEVEWPVQPGWMMTSRVASLPCQSGRIEFTVQAETKSYWRFHRTLNHLLLSFRASTLGAELPTQSFTVQD